MTLPPDHWFRNAVESLDVGVTISDVEGRIIYTNPAEARMHGWQRDELLGRNVRVFAPEDHRVRRIPPERLPEIRAWERETENRRRDGTRFPVRLLSDVVRDEGGRPHGLVTICEDLTEVREAEAKLRQAQKMEILGQLTGGIAHDFNNVLTVILANLDLMASLEPEEWAEVGELIDETRRVARQGAAMARQLLGFSRRDAPVIQPIDLGTLVPQVGNVLKRLLPESIELEIEQEPHLPTVAADPHAVQQILMNLATNARDAMPGGGRMTLRVGRASLDEHFHATHGWGRPGDYVAVEVRDTGIGMDDDTRRQLFEPFFTTKSEGKGTGLGMAMVYSLMKHHRGFVHAASRPGAGTTITLWFPVEEQPAAPEPDETAPPLEDAAGTETVLIVEDEAPIRRAVERGLRKFGYTVLEARDGVEALALWEEHGDRIDLVLTDLVMPRMGGRELAERLRDAGCEVPILLASGYATQETADTLGAFTDGILQKPWTMSDLLLGIREALSEP